VISVRDNDDWNLGTEICNYQSYCTSCCDPTAL
jgi:hypothetical protein